MIKPFSLLAAAFVACAMLANVPPAHAALNPIQLSLEPTQDNALPPDDQTALGLTIGPRPPATQTAPIQTPKLSITSERPFTPSRDFVVGRDAARMFTAHNDRLWQVRPPLELRPEWDFLHRQIAGPGAVERFGDMLDVDEQERPWATTTTVHFLAPNDGWLLPFATLAHQIDADEDFERFGLGAGAMFVISKHATFGAEVIYFGSDHSGSNSGFAHETQFLARLQLEF